MTKKLLSLTTEAAVVLLALALVLSPGAAPQDDIDIKLTPAAGTNENTSDSLRTPSSSPLDTGTPPAAGHTHAQDELPSVTAAESGYFVASNRTGPRGERGFEYWTGNSRRASFTRTGAYHLHSWDNETVSAIYFWWVGASTTALNATEGAQLDHRVNFILGNDSSAWSTGLVAHTAIKYYDVWPGIDLTVLVQDGQLKQEWRVDAGVDIRQIRYAIFGTDTIEICSSGRGINFSTPHGSFQESGLYAYDAQTLDEVVMSFGLTDNVVSLDVADNVRITETVIDPILTWGSYLGGGDIENGRGVAVDENGSVYVTGYTASVDFPDTPGSFQGGLNGSNDVFCSKFAPNGSSLVWSTYLGGTLDDQGYAIDVDSLGRVHLTGYTFSPNFPTTAGAYNESGNGNHDVYYALLSADGANLEYGTYYGDSANERGFQVAWDENSSRAFCYGITWDTAGGLNTTWNAWSRSPLGGSGDTFLAVFSPDGLGTQDLSYATYLGSDGWEWPTGMFVRDGVAYLTGHSDNATAFTTANAMNETKPGGTWDVFACAINVSKPGKAGLTYGTAIGGTTDEEGGGIGLDADGDWHVSGSTSSSDFPVSPDANQTSHAGGTWDAFAVEILPAGAGSADFLAGTYLGGTGDDQSLCALHGPDAPVMAGWTDSTDLPTTADAAVGAGANEMGWIAVHNYTWTHYLTYYGGGGLNERVLGVGNFLWKVASTGYTNGGDFEPSTSGAYLESNPGATSAFAVVEQFDTLDPEGTLYRSADQVLRGETWTVKVAGIDPGPLASGLAGAVIVVDGSNTTMSASSDPQWYWEFSCTFSEAGDVVWSVVVTDNAGHQDVLGPFTLVVSSPIRAPPSVGQEDDRPPNTAWPLGDQGTPWPGWEPVYWWDSHGTYAVITLVGVTSLGASAVVGVFGKQRRWLKVPALFYWIAWIAASAGVLTLGVLSWRLRLFDPWIFT